VRPTDEAQRALSDILCALDGQNYIVLDTETTGLHEPELVSIAIIDRNETPLMDELVRPGKVIELAASRITGITDDLVREMPAFPDIYERIRELISTKLVVIYNASYDLQVLRNTCRRYGLPMPKVNHWCAMEWFARLYGVKDSYRGDYTWQKLSTAASYFAIKPYGAHNALGDCITTLRVVEAGLRKARELRPHMRRLL